MSREVWLATSDASEHRRFSRALGIISLHHRAMPLRCAAGARSWRILPPGLALLLSHCGSNESGSVFNSSGDAKGVREIPALGPVTVGGLCPELRTALDDPSVRDLARERGLELDRVLARATGEFIST